MGNFDKYVKRFDEVEQKRGKAADRGSADSASSPRATSPLVRKFGAGLLVLLVIVAGASYGPSLAGASGMRNPDVSGPEADQDFASLRAMTFRDVQQIQKERMQTLHQLRQSGTGGAALDAANQAAWRVNKVAREKNPD